jgi:hypothetical protein
MIDVGSIAKPDTSDAEVHVRPDTAHRGFQARPDTTDRNVQVRPTTSDVGVDNSVRMSDASVDAEPSTTDAATNTPRKPNNHDTDKQVLSRDWIRGLFKDNPNWVALKIQPIRKKNGKDDSRYVLGENGDLILVKTGKKSNAFISLDWIATENKIRDIYYDSESQSVDEVDSMRDEENLMRTAMRLEKKKRTDDELEKLEFPLKYNRLKNLTFTNKSTSTTSDDDGSRFKMLWIISKNMEMLDSNGLMKSILPIFKDKYKSDKSSLEQYVWVKDGSVDVFGKESNLKHTTALKN